MASKPFIGVLIFFALAATAVATGWYTALSQARILTHSQKIRVQITTSEVHRSVRRHNSVTYSPDIRFRILTPDSPVSKGDQLFPIRVSAGTASSAQRYVDRFQVGSEYDGYVSTVDTPVAYLIASPSVFPYFFLCVGGVLPLIYFYSVCRDAVGNARRIFIVLQILLVLHLVLAVFHGSWIMISY